jgi:hypothetical protein
MKHLPVRRVFALTCLALCVVALVGCTNPIHVEADRARFEAVSALVEDYSEVRPEAAQTWADFLAAWEASLAARSTP